MMADRMICELPVHDLLPAWSTAPDRPRLCYLGAADGEPVHPVPEWRPCDTCGLPHSKSKSYQDLLTLYYQRLSGQNVWEWLADWQLCSQCGRYHTAHHAMRLRMLAQAG
jgi:hypothetical protein